MLLASSIQPAIVAVCQRKKEVHVQKQVLSLKSVPEGLLAKLALSRMGKASVSRDESVRIVIGPFTTRQTLRLKTPARAVTAPSERTRKASASKKIDERLLRQAEELDKRLTGQRQRALDARLRSDPSDDLEPRFRVRLKDRAGADYRDCDCWWLGRHNYRRRNGGDNSWKCHRSAKFRRVQGIDYML